MNLEIHEYLSKENLFGQTSLLMSAIYIVFPLGDLLIHEMIIESAVNFYSSVHRLSP